MINLLSNLLVPGGRARVSPYVQDAQMKVLFDEVPEPQDRNESMRGILSRRRCDVKALADTYIRFAKSGRQFKPMTYETEDFLRLYLAYYFTTNISKVQLCLLDLLKAHKIPSTFSVLDVGVGPGTTAVAVLDFLLAWSTSCHLFGRPFPITDLHFHCYDSSAACLSIAKRVVMAYCESVKRRLNSLSKGNAIGISTEAIISWGMSAEWHQKDISSGPISSAGAPFVIFFASNVLNELPDVGKTALGNTILATPAGSIATVIEPGDKDSCTALNTWKSTLLSQDKGIVSLFPCGDNAHTDSNSCRSCWNARRESLHEPLLYRLLREFTGDPRSFDEFSNNLLSWSYTCFERRLQAPNKPDAHSASELRTRALGMFGWKSAKGFDTSSPNPDTPRSQAAFNYLKLCHATQPGARELWAKREPGFILPQINHGSAIRIHGTTPQPTKIPGVYVLPLGPSAEVTCGDDRTSESSFLAVYSEPSREAVDEIAFRLFGFKAMRPFQHEILGRVLTGRSILGIAATGGGKSECYILPAMLFSGVTIVVSPLKSLMQDQFEKRIDERYGLRNLTTYINGDIPFGERQARLKRIELGYYKLVYFTPEQIRHSYVLNSLKRTQDRVGIRYLALDEAHCISQWGHDFRDSYLNLVTRLSGVGITPVRIALTATASPEVRSDLCEELHLKNEPLASGGDVYVHSSNRAELNLIVKSVNTTEEKIRDIINRLQGFLRDNAHTGKSDAAIVFMPLTGTDPNMASWYMPSVSGENASPKRGRYSAGVTNFASYIERSLQTHVAIYHSKIDFDKGEQQDSREENRDFGDMSGRSRRSEQSAFIEGRYPIMVATKGFGMGIDKPNIRLIIHRTPTSNLESYAQESGRAGRDGEISDVVLYYSPDNFEDDAGIVRRDYEIQDFFLSQKYIRKVDVLAMKEFLASVKRKVCGHLYFTSDEIIPFLDHLETKGNYGWPKFTPRKARGYESSDHVAILNRGYIYREKISYVDRILSALYRIRPDIGNARRVCILDSIQETGAVIRCRSSRPAVFNTEGIVGSNTYFGELLRSKGISASSLQDWIRRCIDEDTIAFANTLGMSLAETVGMLWDINRADGRMENGRWVSALLEFQNVVTPKFGRAQGLTGAAWREYAGASNRTSPAKARERAEYARARGENRDNNKKGQINPTIDDWFGPWELTQPKGWEVCPGAALADSNLFEKYVEAFMAVHNRRQANDRAAYQLLLTDYVGAREDGSLSRQSEAKPCLRAVLLGYLKTGEVVLGNCRSCSRCVPQGNFEKDMAKREKVVERLGTEIIDLLNSLEKAGSKLPPATELSALWKQVETLEAVGKSLRAYVEGWTGRLLTDRPDHKTALWVRIDGMIRGYLPLHPQEACSRAKDLLDATSPNELDSISDSLALFQKAMPDVPEALFISATACYKTGQFDLACDLGLRLLKLKPAQKLIHDAHAMLTDLYDPSGPLPNSDQFNFHSLLAARTTVDFEKKIAFYLRRNRNWQWGDICDELLLELSEHEDGGNTESLLNWWLDSHSKVQKLFQVNPPYNWPASVEEAISWITQLDAGQHKQKTLKHILAGTLATRATKSLNIWPTLCHARGLRIGLITYFSSGDKETLASECLEFLKYASDDERGWLEKILNDGLHVRDHFVKQLVRAEVAFLRGAFETSDEYWRTYIDGSTDGIPDAVSAHVIERLLEIHRPKGMAPDNECLQATLLARIRRSQSWEESEPFYRELSEMWDALRLQDELHSDVFQNDPTRALRLVFLWSELHERSADGGVVLSILAKMDKAILDSSPKEVSAILRKVHPREIVRNPTFGPTWVEKIRNAAKRHASQSSSSKKTLIDWAIEVLVYAFFAGSVTDVEASMIHLPKILFGQANDSTCSLLAVECGPIACDQVRRGEWNILFHDFQPDSIKSLDRWMVWFGSISQETGAPRNRVAEMIEIAMKKALTTDRAQVEQLVMMAERRGVEMLIPDIAIIKVFITAMAKLEKESDVASTEKLDGYHIEMIEHAISFNGNELHADILVAVLREILKRTNPSWLTPIRRLVEALVSTGRTNEATAFGNVPELRVGREKNPVNTYIAKWKGKHRSAPDYDATLGALAHLYVKSWRFRCRCPLPIGY